MAWTWRYLDADGSDLEIETGPAGVEAEFPTQADAESWLGENWRELAAAGIAAVTLLDHGREVYGQMSLEPPE